MKIKEIVDALEMFAPLPLQDGFDNAGLQIGLTDAEVTGALLCLDVTEAVIDEAVALRCNLIVAHHPLLFKGCKSLTGRNYVERCVMKAVKHDIAIYAAHTNLDNLAEGVNHKIAEKIGLRHLRILSPKEKSLLKLVTFVPMAQAGEVREALFKAGCGCIGRYDACSYNVEGEGTFRAGAGTRPFCGQEGELHREPETRIETVLPSHLQGKALQALLAAHPHFLRRVKGIFQTGCVKHNEPPCRLIRKVALCGGAGAFLLPNAVAAQADAFITGEIRYHDYFGHEGEILLAEIGHYESEQFTKEIFRERLQAAFPELELRTSSINTNPIKYL